MRKYLSLLALAVLGSFCVLQSATAFFPHHGKPACEPGYTLVEEVCYKDVIKQVCRPVPDVKKKVRWVYECIQEEFCLPKCPCPLHGLIRHHDCAACAVCIECDKPRTRNLLVKKKVVENIPAVKCVVEIMVEKVPYVIYHKVPCATPAVPGPCLDPQPMPAIPGPCLDPQPMPAIPGPCLDPQPMPTVPGPCLDPEPIPAPKDSPAIYLPPVLFPTSK